MTNAKLKHLLQDSGIQEGLLLCNAMHITASVFINDDEAGLYHDLEFGWRNWRRRSPMRSTSTTGMRIMPMHILNGR